MIFFTQNIGIVVKSNSRINIERIIMAKIQKIELNLTQKIANPFKTTRKSTTNPFKYNDFEGNTLDVSAFADVFEGSNKTTSKLKMISASVAGTMTKIRSSITEPIVQFVNRIKTGVVNAWDYAKNTNLSDIAGLKNISEGWNKAMNIDIVDLGKGIANKIALPHVNIPHIDLSGINEKWAGLVSKINHNRINSETTVAELKTMWLDEIELASKKEVA